MGRPHIQVIVAGESVPDSLRAAVQHIDATASFWPLAEALRAEHPTIADALVVVLPEDVTGLIPPLRVLFDHLADHPRAVLVLSPQGASLPALDHPPTVPVSFAADLDEHDLALRLRTMLEMRESLDSLHRGLLANRRSGESVAKRYMSQLRLASQVQRGFLPEALPRFGRISFEVLFRPVDYVSGDIYDVQRLDEQHVGLALADASGHGIPAALLTVYVKRALRGKEIENGSYRILSPDEVLQRLNDEILEAHLSECPFVAATYAVLNIDTLELTMARGGTPYPLYRRAAGDVQIVDVPGSVVGVLPGARFGVATLQLEPGDSVLLFSDGLERIVAPCCTVQAGSSRVATTGRMARQRADGRGAAEESGGVAVATVVGEPSPAECGRCAQLPSLRCYNSGRCEGGHDLSLVDGVDTLEDVAPGAFRGPTFYAALRQDGVSAGLEIVSGRQRALRRMGYPLDDLTVLALRVDA